MKRLIFLLLCVGVTALAQFPRIEYNKTVAVFSRNVVPTGATTSNDTTKMIDISEATDIALFAYGSDSLKAAYWYRLRNSVTGLTTAWTEFDTVVVATTAAAGIRIGTVLEASLLPYDGVQFYVDYVAGTSTGEAGTDNFICYLYALKRAGGTVVNGQGRAAIANSRVYTVIDKSGWLSTTATDTIPQPSADGTAQYYSIAGGTNIYHLARTNDSLRVTVNYALRNTVARATVAFALLDSIVTVDNLGSAAYDSTIRKTGLTLATILGYDGIRYEEDYDATTAGTATNSDGTTNRWRLYQFFLRRE